MARAVRPLNPQAVAAANAAVADRTTPPGRALTTEPADAELREQWMSAYAAAGGEIQQTPASAKSVAKAVQPCPSDVDGEHGSAGPKPGGGGGESKTERYSDGIQISGPPEYRAKVRKQLDALQKTDGGKQILKDLDAQGKAGKGVTIEPAKPGFNHCRPVGTSTNAYPKKAALNSKTGRIAVSEPGAGTASVVGFDPDYEPKYFDGEPCRPASVGLGHELLHARNNGNGKNLKQFKDMSDLGMAPKGSNHEEAQTIGRGAYAGDQPTDNSLREELGYKARDSHRSVCP